MTSPNCGRRVIDERHHPPVKIYNPLHNVLEHFVLRLAECFQASGTRSALLPSPNGEVGRSLHAKAAALGGHLYSARRNVHTPGANIVVWPLLGWWDMPLWRHSTHQTFIAMHDPQPLARQSGLSPRAAAWSAFLSGSGWPHLITMSPEAHTVASKYFDPSRIHLAPHPMRAPHPCRPKRAGQTVLVLGQYKPARDLEVMAAIAPSLRSRGWQPVVAGRGWPPIPGWKVISRFLTEGEILGLLESAAVLLLPYRHYFQSGVALRALESGIPVVGRETGFLTTILGANFPGAVDSWDDPSSWATAVQQAADARNFQLKAAEAYSTRGKVEWPALINEPFSQH